MRYRVDIDERPDVANQRVRLGDWEADTMMGKGHKSALVTLDGRKSKLRLAFPVANKSAEAVTGGIIALPEGIKDWAHTLTFDNGKQFNPKATSAKHEHVAQTIGCKTYFANNLTVSIISLCVFISHAPSHLQASSP